MTFFSLSSSKMSSCRFSIISLAVLPLVFAGYFQKSSFSFDGTRDRLCENPPNVPGGYVVQSFSTSYIKDDGGLVNVHKAVYQCMDGKAPVGNPISTCRSGSDDITDGQWSITPTCEIFMEEQQPDWEMPSVPEQENNYFPEKDEKPVKPYVEQPVPAPVGRMAGGHYGVSYCN